MLAMAAVPKLPGAEPSGSLGCTPLPAECISFRSWRTLAKTDLNCRLAAARITGSIRIFPPGSKSIGSRRTCSARGKTAARPTPISFCTSRAALPDFADLSAHHGVAFFAAEGFCELRHVGERPVGAELRQGMRIGVGLQAGILRPNIDSPILRVAQEKTLFGCKAVGIFFAGLAVLRFLKRGICQRCSAQIGDAFAFHQFAVLVQAFFGFVAVELLSYALAAVLEALQIFRSPPILQIAARVELRALIVEAVGDFVADDRADAAVVVCVVALGIVKRELQDARGEDDFVELRIVVGIDGGRGHAPLAAVHGLADFGEVARGFKLRGAKGVRYVRAAIDFERGVIAPLIGIADLDGEGFEFFDGCFARGRAHPRKSLQVVAERGEEIVDEVESAGFGFRREILLDVNLAESFANLLIHGGSAPLPARADFLGAGQDAAIESKIFLYEGVGEQSRGTIEQTPAVIGLPVRERDASQQAIERFEKIGLA